MAVGTPATLVVLVLILAGIATTIVVTSVLVSRTIGTAPGPGTNDCPTFDGCTVAALVDNVTVLQSNVSTAVYNISVLDGRVTSILSLFELVNGSDLDAIGNLSATVRLHVCLP